MHWGNSGQGRGTGVCDGSKKGIGSRWNRGCGLPLVSPALVAAISSRLGGRGRGGAEPSVLGRGGVEPSVLGRRGAEPSGLGRRGAGLRGSDVAEQSLRCPPSLLRQSSAFRSGKAAARPVVLSGLRPLHLCGTRLEGGHRRLSRTLRFAWVEPRRAAAPA